MIKMKTHALAFTGLLSFLLLVPADVTEAADEAGVKKANAAFYEALNAMFSGNLEPMKAIWSHAEDVTYLGPDDSYVVGWKAVLADWQKQAAQKLGGEVRPENIHITVGESLAVVQCYERGKNINVGNQPGSVSLRATNVYRKENGQWKMISHHTDLLPFLEKKKQ